MSQQDSPKFTVDQMMDFRPCYSRERVQKLWGRRKALTVVQVLALPIAYGRDQRPSLTAALAPEKPQKCSTCGATDPNENPYCSNGFHAVPSRPVETPAKETAK